MLASLHPSVELSMRAREAFPSPPENDVDSGKIPAVVSVVPGSHDDYMIEGESLLPSRVLQFHFLGG